MAKAKAKKKSVALEKKAEAVTEEVKKEAAEAVKDAADEAKAEKKSAAKSEGKKQSKKDGKGKKDEKKGNAISRWVKDLKMELSKVIWPKRETVVNNSIVVFAAMLGCAVFTWLLEQGFLKLFELAISGGKS